MKIRFGKNDVVDTENLPSGTEMDEVWDEVDGLSERMDVVEGNFTQDQAYLIRKFMRMVLMTGSGTISTLGGTKVDSSVVSDGELQTDYIDGLFPEE